MDPFRIALSVSGTGAPIFSFIFITCSDPYIVMLVRDAVDIGMIARPRVLVPRPPHFSVHLVFRASRPPRVFTRRLVLYYEF